MSLRHLLHFSISVSFSAFTSAAEPAPPDLLRQGLYAEEVSRDPAAAAAQYEQIIAAEDQRRAIVATAIFRLAEVRRQQGKKDEAIKLYQRLLSEFPKAEAEGKLARQHLTELGGKVPAAGEAVVDEEARVIEEWNKLLATAPDTARRTWLLGEAANKDQLRVVRHLLQAGIDANEVQNTLTAAASSGRLEVVKAILELGKLPKASLSHALGEAVRAGNAEVVRALLNAGAGTDWQWHYRGSEFEDQGWSNGGTPLNAALLRGDSAIVDLLLAAKADPNLAGEETGIMPLHAAVMSGVMPLADRTADVRKLLDHGADPNAYTKESGLKNAPAIFAGPVSPLEVVLLYHADPNWDAAKLLMQRGANPKQPVLFERLFALLPDEKALSKIRFLLENGADPNARDPGGDPILLQVVKRGDPELLKLFLKHGADAKVKLTGRKLLREPGLGDPFAATTGKWEDVPGSLLNAVSSKDPKAALEITRLLLDAGAKPDGCLGLVLNRVALLDETGELVRRLLAQRPNFLNLGEIRGLKDWQPASRRIFLDEVLIPALAKEPGPLLFSAITGVRQPLVAPDAAGPPLSTPELLVAQLDALLPNYGRWKGQENGMSLDYSDSYYWPTLTLVRPGANAALERRELDLTGDEPLPELRQGDLLELGRAGNPIPAKQTQGWRGPNADLKASLIWHLRKRITFPVTLELDGKVREIKLRGDLLVFDPTRNEAPLFTAGNLARLFLPTFAAARKPFDENTLLTVRRQGAAEVRMDLSASASYRFELKAGDHLILPDTSTILRQAANPGREPVRLVIPGFSYARTYELQEFQAAGNPKLMAPPPTLVQLLTDAYFPHAERSPFLGDDLDEDAYPTLTNQDGEQKVPVIPPHPDLAHLRIRRTAADGGETVIEVDLTEAIRRCSGETPPAEARQADLELQPGDVVELPLKADLLGQPWNGFSEEEERFFQKALGGFFTLKTGEGIMVQRAILYHQPEWRQTPHGLLPLPPKQGAASVRARLVLQKGESLSRIERGNDRLRTDTSFVRDGDQLLVDASPQAPTPPTAATPPTPGPRPSPIRSRVMPPPAPVPPPSERR